MMPLFHWILFVHACLNMIISRSQDVETKIYVTLHQAHRLSISKRYQKGPGFNHARHLSRRLTRSHCLNQYCLIDSFKQTSINFFDQNTSIFYKTNNYKKSSAKRRTFVSSSKVWMKVFVYVIFITATVVFWNKYLAVNAVLGYIDNLVSERKLTVTRKAAIIVYQDKFQ